MRTFLVVALAASAALLSGCETVDTTKPGTVGVDRNQPLQAPSGRPYYLVKDGRPIPELF